MSQVTASEEALALAEQIKHSKLIVLDVETHETNQHYNKELLGVAIGIPRGLDLETYYVLPEVLLQLQDALLSCEWIGHNLAFDLEIMRENGVDFRGPIWDTMIMSHLCWENEQNYSLDMLSLKYLDLRKINMKPYKAAFDGWNNIPPSIMGRYAQQDIDLTWQLFLQFKVELKKKDLEKLWAESADYVRTLQSIIRAGIRIDRQLVTDLSRETAAQIGDLAVQIRADGLLNPGSVVQLRRYIYSPGPLGFKPRQFTKKGEASTDSAALNELALLAGEDSDRGRKLARILEWRKLSKALSTWYNAFLERMGDRDLLHPGLNQHGTKTGRLSCSEPNLQQIPRNASRVKRVFIDTDNEYLYEFDYSQIELRIASYYATLQGDWTMYKLYEVGEDVHSRTANMIGSIDMLGQVEGRQVGKTGNFLWIYRGGAKRLQATLWRDAKMKVDEARCTMWTEAFHEAYPGFRACNRKAERKHRERGYVYLCNGRRRTIIERDDRKKIKHHIAFNSVVQGGAAVMMMRSLNELRREQEMGAPWRVVNSVHDSAWIYILKTAVEEAAARIVSIMKKPAEEQFKLPFEIDYKRMPGSIS